MARERGFEQLAENSVALPFSSLRVLLRIRARFRAKLRACRSRAPGRGAAAPVPVLRRPVDQAAADPLKRSADQRAVAADLFHRVAHAAGHLHWRANQVNAAIEPLEERHYSAGSWKSAIVLTVLHPLLPSLGAGPNLTLGLVRAAGSRLMAHSPA